MRRALACTPEVYRDEREALFCYVTFTHRHKIVLYAHSEKMNSRATSRVPRRRRPTVESHRPSSCKIMSQRFAFMFFTSAPRVCAVSAVLNFASCPLHLFDAQPGQSLPHAVPRTCNAPVAMEFYATFLAGKTSLSVSCTSPSSKPVRLGPHTKMSPMAR